MNRQLLHPIFALRDQSMSPKKQQVLGVIGELGANYVGNVNSVQLGNTAFEYLFGPRFNWRHSRFTPYGRHWSWRAIFQWLQSCLHGPAPSRKPEQFRRCVRRRPRYRVTNHIAIKPIQVEWLTTQISNNAANINYVQNNLRYSAGVVFRFGSKVAGPTQSTPG